MEVCNDRAGAPCFPRGDAFGVSCPAIHVAVPFATVGHALLSVIGGSPAGSLGFDRRESA
jgi:hypothetical protein